MVQMCCLVLDGKVGDYGGYGEHHHHHTMMLMLIITVLVFVLRVIHDSLYWRTREHAVPYKASFKDWW